MANNPQAKKCDKCGKNMVPAHVVRTMQSEVDSLKEESAALAEALASSNPTALIDRLPPSRDKYFPELSDLVIAAGRIGKGPDETRASLGLTAMHWRAWAAEHPEFKRAVAQHRQLCRAFWFNRARAAMNAGDWSFQTDKVERLLSQMFASEDADAKGDASALVIVDARAPFPSASRQKPNP